MILSFYDITQLNITQLVKICGVAMSSCALQDILGNMQLIFFILKLATNDNVKGLILCGRFVHMYDGNNNDHGTPRATTACRSQSTLHFDLLL